MQHTQAWLQTANLQRPSVLGVRPNPRAPRQGRSAATSRRPRRSCSTWLVVNFRVSISRARQRERTELPTLATEKAKAILPMGVGGIELSERPQGVDHASFDRHRPSDPMTRRTSLWRHLRTSVDGCVAPRADVRKSTFFTGEARRADLGRLSG